MKSAPPLWMYGKLVLTALIWGSSFNIGRYASLHAGPYAVAFVRFMIATLCLGLLCFWREGRLPALNRARLILVVGLALTGVLAYNLLFFSGLQHLPGSRAALIVALNPIFVAIASSVLSRYRLSWRAWGGVAVSLVGALLVISQGHVADLALTFGIGESMILGCCFAWCVYTLMGRQVAATGLSSLGATTWSALFGALFLLLPALFEGQLAQFPWQAWPMQLAMLHLGGLATAVAFIWYADGVKAIGATRTIVFTNFVPVSAVMIGVLLLAEPFHWSMLVGGVLVLGGIWLTNRP